MVELVDGKGKVVDSRPLDINDYRAVSNWLGSHRLALVRGQVMNELNGRFTPSAFKLRAAVHLTHAQERKVESLRRAVRAHADLTAVTSAIAVCQGAEVPGPAILDALGSKYAYLARQIQS